MSLPKDSGNRGKERERGARPKVRQSRSEERRDTGALRKSAKAKKKGLAAHDSTAERPVSDGFEYGELLNDLETKDHLSSTPLKESWRRQGLEVTGSLLGQDRPVLSTVSSVTELSASGDGESRGPNSSRTLRQKIQDAMGQCFPIKTHNAAASPQALSSSIACPSSRRKIHLSELMLDDCPFPVGSDLAQKWYLIKQHTAPITQPPMLDSTVVCNAPSAAVTTVVEDVDDRLRERRRISIEQGVEPPPNAEIHTFEVTAQMNHHYKHGPKLAHGMNDLAGSDRVNALQQQQLLLQRQQQHQLLLQSCLDTLDEVVASASASATAHTGDSDSSESSEIPATNLLSQATLPETEPHKCTDSYRIHTQIDYIHCLVPDLLRITNLPCYWGVMDRYEAETLLEGKPEGTFLLRDSAQEDYLFSVSFRRYGRSLHARIEQWNHNFSFDVHDPSVFHAPTVTGLLEHYKDPNSCMFFEPLLSNPIFRTHPFSLQHICRAVISSCTTYDGINMLPIPNALKKHLKEYHYKQRVRVRRMDTWWE